MNAINRTTITAQVNAAFRLDVADKITAIKHEPYILGTFANFDYSIAVSMMWDVRTKLLSLMPGTVTTAETPREGTYAAQRGEHPEARDRKVEREECETAISVLARVEEHLALKAKDETTKVKGEDITPTHFYEFRPYMSTTASFIADRREWVISNLDKKGAEIQLARLDEMARLDEGDFKGAGIGINEALEKFHAMVAEGENRERVAFNAWAKLRSNLLAYEDGFQKFEDARAFINALDGDEAYYSSTMSKFAKINAEWNTKAFKLGRAIENNLNATPLLAHIGPPKDLINSPEWATMVIQVETIAMEKDAMLLEANLRKVRAKKAQVDVAKRMAALQAELEDELDPKRAAKKAEAAQPTVLITEAPPKDTKSNGGCGVNIIGKNTLPSYTHR